MRIERNGVGARRIICVFAVMAASAGVSRSAPSASPDFTRSVRPILSEHCFKCHGPDDAARQAGLRLDLREVAIAKSESGTIPIVAGKPDASEVLRRVLSHDPDEVMPPPAANKPLSEEKKRILRDWIAAGAEYKPHWAFVPPKPALLPSVHSAGWTANPIDNFILSRLESAGLSPSPEADRYTLIRRVSLDLVGLPPTPEEADAFANDRLPNAYERLVDRLLSSPHYGERWGRRWLDLARYADTNGYEKDRARSIWPYRDWVIHALNADMPFDRFSIAQLAGDMLPRAALSDRIATGFHRNTMLNEEGGIDPLEFRFYAMVDRVSTTGVVWLGLTVGCAQCHTHKFDPIPHRDYYRLFGFLNNADEIEIDVPNSSAAAQRTEIDRKIAKAESDLPRHFPPGGNAGRDRFAAKFADWERKESKRAIHWTPLHPVAAKATRPYLAAQADQSILVSGDQGKSDRYDVAYDGLPSEVRALRLEVLPDDSLPKHGPGRVFYEGPFGDFVLSELSATADEKPVHFQRAAHSFSSTAGGAAAAIDGNPLTAWSINGGQGKSHAAVFVLDAPLQGAKRLALNMLFEYYYACGLGRFRLSATNESVPADRPVLPPAIDDVLTVPPAQRRAEQEAILVHYFASITPELAAARKEIETLRKDEPAFPTTLVMKERPAANPRKTFIHKRGEFLQPTTRVEPELPSMFAGLRNNRPRNRLEFARWLVDPQNPMVGRVTMNRQWQAFFGQGLVRTTEDFGYQGSPATHPELLDWLALELVRNQWSLKAMHRLIVTSATYRQSSHVTPELFAKDSENRLVSRAPRRRLDAELIRDLALKSSGLLSEQIGGPSVFPPQPASVTTEGTYGGLSWNVSTGSNRYRRGLYTFTKRTAPFAMLATFDAPSGEACVARREVTDTPLQALTLLNDAMFVEIAQGMAGDVTRDTTQSAEQIARTLFRRLLTRPPSSQELAALVAFHAKAVEQLPEKTSGAGKTHASANLAAWMAVARSLLNLDETITRE